MAETDEKQAGAKPEASAYDVVIIGAGMAGLSAAIYTTRERLATLILEKLYPGGQILTTARVENYPGFPEPIGGMELADRLSRQAQRFGAEIVSSAAVDRLVPCTDAGCPYVDAYVGATRYRGRSVILCVGSEYRKLGCPGEKELTGYGVSYCGTCDAPFYEDKHVVVVGGGNTALDEGLHLLKFVRRLTYVVLDPEFRGEKILQEELANHPDKVATHFESTVTEIFGEKKVTGVRVKNAKTGEEAEVACDGVFVFIGLEPQTAFLKGTLDLDPQGFIRTDACTLRTTLPGVWAAGDVRAGSLKQAATAAGEGVVAALGAKEYLKRQHGVRTRT
ncbi:MAG TPA: FAD-dependent oxidoreductase [Phycisphaerae bacterium]|nr:FAD-dependent oxidoreductase [Phycisphaerae bacterium]